MSNPITHAQHVAFIAELRKDAPIQNVPWYNKAIGWLTVSYIKCINGFNAEKIATYVAKQLQEEKIINAQDLRWFSNTQLTVIADKIVTHPQGFEEFIKKAVCFARKEETQRKILALLGTQSPLYLKYMQPPKNAPTDFDAQIEQIQKQANPPITDAFNKKFRQVCTQGLIEKKFDVLEDVFKKIEAIQSKTRSGTLPQPVHDAKAICTEMRKKIEVMRTFEISNTNKIHQASRLVGEKNNTLVQITENEWKAIETLMKKYTDQSYTFTDTEQRLIESFLLHTCDNTTFNTWARKWLNELPETTPEEMPAEHVHIFTQLLEQITAAEFKTRSDSIKKAEKACTRAEKILEIITTENEIQALRSKICQFDAAVWPEKSTEAINAARTTHLSLQEKTQNEIAQLQTKLAQLNAALVKINAAQELPDHERQLSLDEMSALLKITRAKAAVDALKTRSTFDHPRTEKITPIAERAERLLAKIREQIDLEEPVETGTISFSNVIKMSKFGISSSPMTEFAKRAFHFPFWHTQIRGYSEGVSTTAHQTTEFTHEISTIEDDLTFDHYFFDLAKIATPKGRGALKTLFEHEMAVEGTHTTFMPKDVMTEAAFENILREEVSFAFEQIIDQERDNPAPIKIDEIKVPYDTFNSLQDVESWLSTINEHRDPPITISQILAPNPEADFTLLKAFEVPEGTERKAPTVEGVTKMLGEARAERKKGDLRNQQKQQFFPGLSNPATARENAYKQSWVFIRPLRSLIETFAKEEPLEKAIENEEMICSQFAYRITLGVFAQVEGNLKLRLAQQYINDGMTPDTAMETANALQLFDFPKTYDAKYRAMTSEMFALEFKKFLTPRPMPSIYKQLIKEDPSYFESQPLQEKSCTEFFTSFAKGVAQLIKATTGKRK